MIAKNGSLALTAALLSSLYGCGGGGGGGDSDPGEQSKAVLDITVTGLVTKLDVNWMGQTITMSPERFTAHVESESAQSSPPEYQSPEYQNCDRHKVGSVNNHHTLDISCNEPDTIRLLASATGLRGELKFSWNGQEVVLNEANPNRVVESKLGEFHAPAITAIPDLQECTEEQINKPEGSRAFDYKITCVDKMAVNKILLDKPLPYAVTLSAGEESLSIQPSTASFGVATSRIDGVTIADIGGTQQCNLEKLDYFGAANEQSWRLSCREYLVVSDGREGQVGIYLIYSDGEKSALELGNVDISEVKTFPAGQAQLVLHPDFGVRVLDFSAREVVWKSLDGLPEGKVLQTHVTDGAAYISYVLQDQGSNLDYHSIWRVDKNLTPANLLRSKNKDLLLTLLPVSGRDDVVAIDVEDTVTANYGGKHSVYRSRSGKVDVSDVIRIFGVPNLDKVIQVVEGDAEDWYLFHFNESSLKVDFVLNKGNTLLESLVDRQTNIVTWYDESNKKRILKLGSPVLDVGSLPTDRQLTELIIGKDGEKHTYRWEAPRNFPTGSLGYMGTDGKTLVITDNEYPLADGVADGLVALYTRQGRVDLASLSRAVGFTLPLRVRPIERFITYPPFKEVKPVNGWILMFEGQGETGDVWATDGRAEHTWKIASDVSWEGFKGDFTLIAAGANMVAVSYLMDDMKQFVVLSPELIPR